MDKHTEEKRTTSSNMKLLVSLSLLASAAVTVLAADELGIEVTQAVNCERKTKSVSGPDVPQQQTEDV